MSSAAVMIGASMVKYNSSMFLYLQLWHYGDPKRSSSDTISVITYGVVGRFQPALYHIRGGVFIVLKTFLLAER